jgi:hypothetical protein
VNERERIHKMVEAGTITEGEAERLLSVLREIDQADGELAASAAAMEDEARQVERMDGPEPGADAAVHTGAAAAGPAAAGPAAAAGSARRAPVPGAAPVPAGEAPAGSRGPASAEAGAGAPRDTRWVRVSLLAGDVSVRADPDVDEVVVRGDTESVRVEATADGFTVGHAKGEGQESWVDRFLSRIRSGHVELRVPAGYGVDLAVTAGDVEIRGVPFLRGRLTSGNLDARGLHGIDFTTAAGDINVEMTLTEGRHSLRATAGDVSVRLGAGSNVEVDGSVSIGSASVRAPGFEADRRGVGQRFRGRVGAGRARLDLHVTTGDVDVKVSDER